MAVLRHPRCIFPFAGIFLLALLLHSCEKPEGPGGKGIIRGQVIVKTYDPQFRVLQSTLPAADEDVYIIYGSSETISDDRTTSPEGKFEFKYLSKGDYKIFVYSEDSTGNPESGTVPVERSVNLSSNSQEVDLGQIYIYETMEVDDGNASIVGQVLQVNYWDNFQFIIDTTYAQEVDVYLSYEDDLHYSDRVRTQEDGSFAFAGLIKGNYRVFTYSEDVKRGIEKIPVTKSIQVDALQGLFDAGILYIAKED
jgi:hypothetical protein